MDEECFSAFDWRHAAVQSIAGSSGRSANATGADAVTAAVFNWTGIYVGVNGHYGWGAQDPIVLLSNRFDRTSFDLSGGTMGAQIQQGYALLRVEGDLGLGKHQGKRHSHSGDCRRPWSPDFERSDKHRSDRNRADAIQCGMNNIPAETQRVINEA